MIAAFAQIATCLMALAVITGITAHLITAAPRIARALAADDCGHDGEDD